MPTWPAGTWNNRGFTLIELAVVVALLSLLATLVIPRLEGRGDRQLQAESRRLAATVRALYDEVALRRRAGVLRLDLDRQQYAAALRADDGTLVAAPGALSTPRRLEADLRLALVQRPGAADAHRGQVDLEVLPTGWFSPATLWLQDADNRRLALEIQPLTGIARMTGGANGTE